MGTFTSKSAFGVFTFISFLIGGQWVSADPAPVYPGKVIPGGEQTEQTDGEGGSQTRTYKIYYTRDSISKVVAYYEGKFPDKLTENSDRVVFAGPRGSTLEDDAVIVWRNASGLTESDLLDPLEEEVASASAGLKKSGHRRKDLESVKKKYGYLANEAFFPNFSAEDKLAACQDSMESDVNSAEQDQLSLQEKLEGLAKEGRFAEMQQYMSQAEQLTSNTVQAMSASHWDEWVACLDELDSGAFRAGISIRIK